jgi:predicted TIM-barrel fold metal-dependent hydrolase
MATGPGIVDGHYTVVSADCHAGGSADDYAGYLDPSFREAYGEWRRAYANPFRDLQGGAKVRNWDDDLRTRELEAEGIAAEVVFPNTVPPFFPTGQLIARPPRDGEDHRRRLAGLRAHNRWLVDWCGRRPGRRIGLAQVFLNDVDEAVADATRAAETGLAGVLIPAVPPDSDVAPLFSRAHDPFWAACADLDLVVVQHGGGGLPAYRDTDAAFFLLLMEARFFANRSLWHLVLSGVFERHPSLRFVMTEQGVAWLPAVLEEMDGYWEQMRRSGRVGELDFDADAVLARPPREYVAENVWIGASFPAPSDAAVIAEVGVDRVMWGADYPHDEGTQPDTTAALRRSFHDWEAADLATLLAGTAATVYGVDLEALAPVAIAHGPRVDEVAEPLWDVPPDNASPAFTRA